MGKFKLSGKRAKGAQYLLIVLILSKKNKLECWFFFMSEKKKYKPRRGKDFAVIFIKSEFQKTDGVLKRVNGAITFGFSIYFLTF